MIDNDQPVIVVGIDGSDLSIGALKWAADHARRIHGRILAVTGYEVPWTIFLAPTATEADYARAAREVLARTVVEALGSDGLLADVVLRLDLGLAVRPTPS